MRPAVHRVGALPDPEAGAASNDSCSRSPTVVVSPATHTRTEGGSIPLVIAPIGHTWKPRSTRSAAAPANELLRQVDRGIAQRLSARADAGDGGGVGVDAPPVGG